MHIQSKGKHQDAQPTCQLTKYIDELNSSTLFTYYPEYNPLRKLGLPIPATTTVPDKLYCVKPREANEQLDNLTDQYRTCVKKGQPPSESPTFVQLYRSAAALIDKHSEGNNAKALTLKVIGAQNRFSKHNAESIAKWLKQAIKHNYPLALYLLGILAMQEKRIDEGYWHLHNALDRGEVLACVPLASIYESEMYRSVPAAYTYNLLGCSNDIYESCVRLAWMYVTGNYTPRDLGEALKLLRKAETLSYNPNYPPLVELIKKVSDNKRSQDALHNQTKLDLQMNDLQESWIIEGHLRYLQGNLKHVVRDLYSPRQNCVNYFELQTKTFYLAERTVECGLIYQLLVLNQEGMFDRICIHLIEDRDKRYPRDLLTKVGTKVVLKFLNRKIALDGMLQYCVVNPLFIEFQPPGPDAQKYRLPNSRIREMAKRLFKYEMYQRGIYLYSYLTKKCPEDNASLYCNISLCLMRMQRYSQAELYALKSLELSPLNQKSTYRLSYCLWKLGRLDQAKLRLKKLKQLSTESQSLLTAINKELLTRAQHLDFSSKQYSRTQAPIFKQLYFQIDRPKQYELVFTDSEVRALVRNSEKLLRNCMNIHDMTEVQLTLLLERLVKLSLDWRHETYYYKELKLLFAMSYGYVKHHTKIQLFTMKDILTEMELRRSDLKLAEPIKTNTKVLCLRQTHLENRIESAVLSMVDFGRHPQAIELCKVAIPYNSILAHRCIELLRGLEKYQEAIKMANTMIKELSKAGLSYEQFSMSNAKSYRSMGKYENSNRQCSSLYDRPMYCGEAYLLTSLNLFTCGLLDQALVKVNRSREVRDSPEAGLHQIRLLLLTKKPNIAIQAARQLEGDIEKQQSCLTKNMLLKACLNLELKALLQLHSYEEFVKCCQRIYVLDRRNINFVEDQLWLFIHAHSWFEDKIIAAVESHDDMKEVAAGIRERQAALHEDDFLNDNQSVDPNIDPECKINPIELHKQHLKQKEQLKSPDCAEIDASFDLSNLLLQEFSGYVSHFHYKNKLHVVLFEENLWMDSAEKGQFYRAAAKGFAKTSKQSPGIKILENGFYELKIMHSDYRLIGRKDSCTDKTVIRFNRRVSHTEVRRVVLHG